MIAIVGISYILLLIYEFVPLLKQKLFRDLITNLVIWFLSFLLAILLAFGVKLYSPLRVIEEIIVSVFGRN